MIVGIDGGYSAFKTLTDDKTVHLPSVAGTVDKARFTMNGHHDIILSVNGQGQMMVGDAAIRQSRFAARREDRGWIESPEYLSLVGAAFTELTNASLVNMNVVTGLPVSFYERDKEALRDLYQGEHKVKREGRNTQVFRVKECRVIPQPFGTVFSKAINHKGVLQDNIYSTGNVGIIDIGGKTTNLLSVSRLEEISNNTASVNRGAWDIVRAFRAFAETQYPGMESLKDHEVIKVIVTKKRNYFGKELDLTKEIDEIVSPLANDILSQSGNLWGNGALLDTILITGGGALLMSDYITSQYPHSSAVDDPVNANARGYYRFGLFSERQSS